MRTTRPASQLRSLMLTALMMAGLSSATAMAGSYVVNSTADTTDNICDMSSCTLREAVGAANADSAADTITFDSIVFGAARVITLNSALSISASLSIIGSPAGVAISGNGASTVFVLRGGTSSFSNLTITGGRGPDSFIIGGTGGAGGIQLYNCSLTLVGCTLAANTGGDGADAYGPYPRRAGGPGGVGGIFVSNLYLTLVNSTVSGNTGGQGGNGAEGTSIGATIRVVRIYRLNVASTWWDGRH